MLLLVLEQPHYIERDYGVLMSSKDDSPRPLFLMDLEILVEKFVDGEKLSRSERKFLLLSLNTEKTEVARFRVSKAEKMLLRREAQRNGLSLSDYLRNLTVRQTAVSLLSEHRNESETH